jgi:hypothetical protein
VKSLALCVVLCAACGGATAPDDLAALSIDLALPAADGGIACGTPAACNVSNGNVCCVEPDYEFCGNPEACSGSGVALYCNGPADCGGEPCCLVNGNIGACVASCGGTQLCGSDADCPTTAPHCCQAIVAGTQHLACAASCS